MTTSMHAMNAVSIELKAIAAELDARLTAVAGERLNFSLFIWTQPRCSYISTADRREVIKVLEGMIAGWKAGMPDVPAHEVQ